MIYFLRHVETGLIKIGVTRKYRERNYALKLMFGSLELLGLMDGGYDVEDGLHNRFKAFNVRGVLQGAEWFKPVPELLKFIKQNTSLNFPLPFTVDSGKRRFPVSRGKKQKLKRAPRNRPGVHNRLWELVKERELLEKRRISSRELSRRTGVGISTINAWFRDDVARFDDRICEAFLRYFECKSVNELLYIVPDQPDAGERERA